MPWRRGRVSAIGTATELDDAARRCSGAERGERTWQPASFDRRLTDIAAQPRGHCGTERLDEPRPHPAVAKQFAIALFGRAGRGRLAQRGT